MKYDYQKIARDVRRALLVTASFQRVLDDGRVKILNLSDNQRRMLALLNELSFEAGEPGVWLRDRISLGRSLSIDKSNCSKVLAELVAFELVVLERREDGWLWLELRAAKLAVAGRALEARAVIEELELAHYDHAHQPEIPLIGRSLLEGRNGGFDAAMQEVATEQDREAFAALTPVGNPPTPARKPVGDPPTTRLVNYQPKTPGVGDLPTVPVDNRAPACMRGDSANRQIGDSNTESGAVALDGGKRFRDSEKNWIFGELLEIDQKGELQDETSRRTWLGRIRDFPIPIREAIGEVKDERRRGQPIHSPLGKVFSKARTLARSSGKVLRSILFTF